MLTVNILIKIIFRVMKMGAEPSGALVLFPALWLMLMLSSSPQDASESTKILKKFLTTSDTHNNIYIWQGLELRCTFGNSTFFSRGLWNYFFSLKSRINSNRFLLFHSFFVAFNFIAANTLLHGLEDSSGVVLGKIPWIWKATPFSPPEGIVLP